MNFFKYTIRPYGYEPLEGNTINFILLPPDVKKLLVITFLVCFIVFSFFFYKYKKAYVKTAFLYGFLSASILTALLFSIRNDYMWLQFSENLSERYGTYTSNEKFMRLEVQNWGLHPFFMRIKPYIKGDYKLLAPNLSKDSIDIIMAKANFILPFKMSENARYLIVIDKTANFDSRTGILTIGGTQVRGLEPVFFYDKAAFVLKFKQ